MRLSGINNLEAIKPMYGLINISSLIGMTFVKIEADVGSDVMTLTSSTGETYQFYHEQGCCENVCIEDLDNDPNVLAGSPLLVAEERISDAAGADYESATWTFYTFATVKGTLTVRWLGTSNGYYSERVSLVRVR